MHLNLVFGPGPLIKGHESVSSMFSYQAINLWYDIPHYVKDLSTFSFAKEVNVKHYLLSLSNLDRNAITKLLRPVSLPWCSLL